MERPPHREERGDEQGGDGEDPATHLPGWLPLPAVRTRWGLVFGLALSIFAVSLMGNPIDWENPGPGGSTLLTADKLAHLATYFALAFLIGYALIERESPWRLPLAFLAATLVGALVELVQTTLPHRNAEAGDLLANLIGAGLAWLLWWSVLHIPGRRRDT